MPNQALQQFLKSSTWFPAFAETHGFGNLDEALQFYAVNAPLWNTIAAGGTISPDESNVSAMGTNAPQSPSLSGVVDAVSDAMSSPQNIGTAVGMATGIPGASMVGNPIGAALGDLGFGVPVDTANLGMFGTLGVGALRSLFGMVPRDMFSPAELQSAHPDIGPQPSFESPSFGFGETSPGIGGFGAPGQFGTGVATGPGVSADPHGVDAPSSAAAGGVYGGPDPSQSREGGIGVGGQQGNEGGSPGGGMSGSEQAQRDAGEHGAPGGSPGSPGSPGNDAGGGGFYRGGSVTRKGLRGYYHGGPAGPDDGYAALDIGEFVFTDNAVRWHGLKKLMAMQAEAEKNPDPDMEAKRERAEDRGMYRGGLFRKRDLRGYARGFGAPS